MTRTTPSQPGSAKVTVLRPARCLARVSDSESATAALTVPRPLGQARRFLILQPPDSTGPTLNVARCQDLKLWLLVIPAQAGIQRRNLDSRLRGNDEIRRQTTDTRLIRQNGLIFRPPFSVPPQPPVFPGLLITPDSEQIHRPRHLESSESRK